ncbi:hypothetical protein AVEN_172802-1 [Araneus ventricosus]|uniref:Uncharacterized protein n=1 Tax=Araneus ventricosus TaxID=182803 RepID=A0A4Y2BIX7_ARAVE|nr:hypothetical protein AVEN_172802-1 [Araneus ventricosus]
MTGESSVRDSIPPEIRRSCGPSAIKGQPSSYWCGVEAELHQDKESSYTSQCTIKFPGKNRTRNGPYTDIPSKSPDVSSMDFFAFGLVKSALSKSRPTTLCGLWIAVQKE